MKTQKNENKRAPKRLMVQTRIRAGTTQEEMVAEWQEMMENMNEKMAEARYAMQESISATSS